jgi:hypothetical protein
VKHFFQTVSRFIVFFKKLYDDKFIIETDTKEVDGYVEEVFILETKSDFSYWLPGFYQALQYQKRFGLALTKFEANNPVA